VAFARATMAEPKVRAVYKKMAAKKHKRQFDIAVSDYFKRNDLISKKRDWHSELHPVKKTGQEKHRPVSETDT